MLENSKAAVPWCGEMVGRILGFVAGEAPERQCLKQEVLVVAIEGEADMSKIKR
jgi:hypothetical protein